MDTDTKIFQIQNIFLLKIKNKKNLKKKYGYGYGYGNGYGYGYGNGYDQIRTNTVRYARIRSGTLRYGKLRVPERIYAYTVTFCKNQLYVIYSCNFRNLLIFIKFKQ